MRFLTIAQRLQEMTIACSDGTCDNRMAAAQAKVPDLLNLYMGLEKPSPVDKGHPLNSAELARQARCIKHPLGQGIRMYPLLETAALMDRWANENARRMDLAQRPHHQRHQPRDNRPTSIIGKILAERKPEVEKPRPQHRFHTHKHLPKPPQSTVKRFGDEGRKNTPVISAKAAAKAAKAAKEQAKKAKKAGR